MIGNATEVIMNSNATASSTSGMTNEKSITTLAPLGSRPRHRSTPMANSTPNGTVISVAMTPSLRVWNNAVCSAASCQTERVSSPQYHRNEKPCQSLRDRPSLKENHTAISTGSSDHIR
ncbi:MAG: hypothetical protein K0R68_2480 [Mycobacterium sp.]|nr:hypothetical protein [Mycobacterium sp.]